MNIQSWFKNNGSFKDGVKLYSELPNKSNLLLRSFNKETPSNFLKLKYELKKALNSGFTSKITEEKKEVKLEIKSDKPLLQEVIQESITNSFQKETMAMYPIELHSVFRTRVSSFYEAAELKFKLNELPEDNEHEAYNLMLKIEELWNKVDKCWSVLDHWKEHNRIMPYESKEDFSSLSPLQLFSKRDRLEVSISKRKKTLKALEKYVKENPEDKAKERNYISKTEQLEQLIIDLNIIKELISKG